MARPRLNVPDADDPLIAQLSLLLASDLAMARWAADDTADPAVWALAARHGVEPLLAWRFLNAAPASARDRQQARRVLAKAVAEEELRRRELTRIADAFARERIALLLLKGAAWAYTLYPAAALRPSLDIDLFVDADGRSAAERLLLSLGYSPAVESVMQLASGQRHLERTGDYGVPHYIDLHWRITNPLVFADAMPFAPCWARSVAIPALGEARALCRADALLHACLHRIAHHGDGSRLRWLMDVHLLASALDEKEWKDFIARADAIRLRPVCVLSIRRAAACLGTPLPAAVRGWLAEPVDQQLDAVFRGAQVSPLGVLASDWRAAGSWRGRASLLRDHLLPDPGYIRARYTLARHLPLLPLCYLHRAVVGLARWSRGYIASLPARTFPPAPPRRRARPERV